MNYRIMNRMLGVEWWVLRNCCFRIGRLWVERGLWMIVRIYFQLERRVLYISYSIRS
jgi:hypothetical protein